MSKYIKANDPKVIDLIHYLGIDPEGVSKVVIIIEAQKYLVVEVTTKIKDNDKNLLYGNSN